METNSKIYQLKQIVKQIAVLQRTIKNHRKTVNFKGKNRETIELYTWGSIFNDKTRKYETLKYKSKILLTSSNAKQLIEGVWGFTPNGEGSTKIRIDHLNIIPMDDINFESTQQMAYYLNTAYALLRYERKTKKNEQLESIKHGVDNGHMNYLKKVMDYFRDEEDEQKAQ